MNAPRARSRIAIVATTCALGCIATARGPATEDEVAALEPRAIAGDRAAVRALFELYPLADGAVAEGIDMALGNVVRPHPRLLLEEWLHSGLLADEWVRGHLLGNLIEWVDDCAAQQREIGLRIAALETVTVPSLHALRDACLATLRAQLASLTQ
jgi:hypothetical protein